MVVFDIEAAVAGGILLELVHHTILEVALYGSHQSFAITYHIEVRAEYQEGLAPGYMFQTEALDLKSPNYSQHYLWQYME